MKTKALIESCDTIKQIAKTRGVTEGTIMNHLSTLKKEEPQLDLSKFQPSGELVQSIEEIIVQLENEKSEENFSDDGRLRLKPIFEALDIEVSYDKIREVMLFRD
jgi:predicted transcriptional regulator